MKEPEAKKAVDLTKEQGEALVPYFSVDREMHRLEKFNKRIVWLLVLTLAMLFATNGAWIVYEMQYETYYYQQDVNSEGADAKAFLNTGEGDLIYNGESTTSSQNP